MKVQSIIKTSKSITNQYQSEILVIYYLDLQDIERIYHKLKPPPKALGYLYKGGVTYMIDEIKYIYEEKTEKDAIIGKAAYLWHTLASNQYFADGNKRLGFVVSDTFLRINGLIFKADVNYKHEISSGLSLHQYDVEDVRIFLTQSLK